MAVAGKDRVKASRIRKKGANATADDARWLADYERSRSPQGAHVAAARAPAPPRAAPAPAPPRSSAPEPEPFRVIDFGAPDERAQPGDAQAHDEHDAPACEIKDCPRCAAVKGAMVCGTTGERVWPMMSDDGAEGIAAGVLGGIALLARFLGGRDVKPERAEVKALGRAIQRFIYKRAGWAGAGDDVIALAFLLTMFATRAYNAPKLPG